MYLLKRDSLSYTNLAMTNEDAQHPKENILSEYTQDTARSNANTTVISFDVPILTDVDLFNIGSVDATGNRKELVTGTITIKEQGSGTVLGTEAIDFYTASTVAYMATNNLTYHRNIRAFHGEQIFYDVTVEIALEADAGDFVDIGIITAGQFVKYGRATDAGVTSEKATFSGTALIAEYNNLLNQIDDEEKFFFHTNSNQYDGENLYMGYGIPTIGSAKHSTPTTIKYSVEFEV